LDDISQLKANDAYYRRRLVGGVSAALAAAALPTMSEYGSGVAVAYGAYGGGRAAALGYTTNNEGYQFNIAVTKDTASSALGMSVGYLYKLK
jgi:autotransporter adhesin